MDLDFILDDINSFIIEEKIGEWDGTHRDIYLGERVTTTLSHLEESPTLFLHILIDGWNEYRMCIIDNDTFKVNIHHDFMKNYSMQWINYRNKIKLTNNNLGN